MKRALVVGGAECWRNDLIRAKGFDVRWDLIIGVNDVGTVLQDIDELCTLHHEGRTMGRNMPPKQWGRIREENGLPPVPVVAVASSEHWPNDIAFRGWTDGSSGLYGVSRAILHHGCDRVVLCGVPLDARANAFRDADRWAEFRRYRRGWEKVTGEIRDKVRSMSGWTRDEFGAPTVEWLAA